MSIKLRAVFELVHVAGCRPQAGCPLIVRPKIALTTPYYAFWFTALQKILIMLMSNQITSQVLGSLMQDKSFPDWWKSEEVPIPLFDGKKLPVIFMDYEPKADESFVSKADEALTSFFALGESYRESISHLIFKNCREFLEAVGFDEADQALRDINDENEIWRFVHPSEIYVTRRPYKDQDMYVQIACECDWEQEHGLQLVFRQGRKLTRVSNQDGHLTEADAYDKPDEEDELLSKF